MTPARPLGAALLALVLASPALLAAQSARPTQQPLTGYVLEVETRFLVPEIQAPAGTDPETRAALEKLRERPQLATRMHLTQALSRQEVLSDDFVVPRGTLLYHKTGDRLWTLADPRTRSYMLLDAEALIGLLEGGVGITGTQYDVKVLHTGQTATVSGLPCQRSVATISYVTSIPYENDRVLMRQTNTLQIWHTRELISPAFADHFFFKFQRDQTGQVRRVLQEELGFPLEMTMTVTQGGGRRPPRVVPGSFHVRVTSVKLEKAMDPDLFRTPPAGYRRTEKLPYFREGALSEAGAQLAGEDAPPGRKQ